MNDFEPSLQSEMRPAGVAVPPVPGADFPVERRIPPKLYRIGEVVSYSRMSRQTIHNYTTMGLLKETRWTDGGHRLYDESVFARLDHIIRMRQSNKSIQQIREFLASVEAGQ